MAFLASRDPSFLAIALVVVLGPSALARADSVSLASSTDCPSAEEVRAELPEDVSIETDDATSATWTIAVQRTGARVTVTVRRAGAEEEFSRSFRSRDCATLAAAIAEVVRAHLVELRVWESDPVAASVVVPIDEVTIVPEVVPTVPVPEVVEVPVVSAPIVEAPVPVEPPRAPTDASAARRPIRVALSGGGRIESDGPRALGLGTLTVVGAPIGPLIVRGALSIASPIEISSAIDRVRIAGGGLRAGLGVRSDRDVVEVEAALEAGLDLALVTALDLPNAPTQTRALPSLSLSTAVALPLVPELALRLDVSIAVLLIEERYRIEPEGEVARSSPFRLDMGLGLEWAP